MAEIVSRKDAIASGLPRYFTGKPCTKGHIAERYTKNKTCCLCANELALTAKRKNRDKYRLMFNEWQRNNPEKVYASRDRYYAKNPGLRNFWTMRYRQARDYRSPSWITPVHNAEIESTYAYCAALRKAGIDCHVDHIIPLRGNLVSGLHVPENLQVISRIQNVRKGNKYVV